VPGVWIVDTRQHVDRWLAAACGSIVAGGDCTAQEWDRYLRELADAVRAGRGPLPAGPPDAYASSCLAARRLFEEIAEGRMGLSLTGRQEVLFEVLVGLSRQPDRWVTTTEVLEVLKASGRGSFARSARSVAGSFTGRGCRHLIWTRGGTQALYRATPLAALYFDLRDEAAAARSAAAVPALPGALSGLL
jgi:hypothetical protein